MSDKSIDCLVVGGGPAGLTAAIYLARFHLNTIVVDAGNGRATWIPVSHNHAGFPEGIHGADLVAKMADQARLYGAHVVQSRVTRLDVDEERVTRVRLGLVCSYGTDVRSEAAEVRGEVQELLVSLVGPDPRGAVDVDIDVVDVVEGDPRLV